MAFESPYFPLKCTMTIIRVLSRNVFPENILSDPTEGYWVFDGEGVVVVGISKAKHLKAKYGIKLELLKGWEKGLNPNLSGRLWVFLK